MLCSELQRRAVTCTWFTEVSRTRSERRRDVMRGQTQRPEASVTAFYLSTRQKEPNAKRQTAAVYVCLQQSCSLLSYRNINLALIQRQGLHGNWLSRTSQTSYFFSPISAPSSFILTVSMETRLARWACKRVPKEASIISTCLTALPEGLDQEFMKRTKSLFNQELWNQRN